MSVPIAILRSNDQSLINKCNQLSLSCEQHSSLLLAARFEEIFELSLAELALGEEDGLAPAVGEEFVQLGESFLEGLELVLLDVLYLVKSVACLDLLQEFLSKRKCTSISAPISRESFVRNG